MKSKLQEVIVIFSQFKMSRLLKEAELTRGD
jgi:hypothetical protein